MAIINSVVVGIATASLLALDKLAEGSKLTMDDVLEVDRLVKKGIAERLRKRETSHRYE